MKDIKDESGLGPLGRRMFFKIENASGRDKCAFCSTSLGAMLKHMATGKNICPSCLTFLEGKMNEPDEIAPMHQECAPIAIGPRGAFLTDLLKD